MPPPPWGDEKESEFQLGAAESHHQDPNHHDPATCPFCQAALSGQNCAVTTLSRSAVLSSQIRRVCNCSFISVATSPGVLICGPRSPPVFLSSSQAANPDRCTCCLEPKSGWQGEEIVIERETHDSASYNIAIDKGFNGRHIGVRIFHHNGGRGLCRP